jgi:hypothetical protein
VNRERISSKINECEKNENLIGGRLAEMASLIVKRDARFLVDLIGAPKL